MLRCFAIAEDIDLAPSRKFYVRFNGVVTCNSKTMARCLYNTEVGNLMARVSSAASVTNEFLPMVGKISNTNIPE